MNRKWIIGAIVAAVVVVGALVGISLAGGDDKTVSSIEGVSAVKQEFDGVPSTADTIGKPDAPVTILEYGDMACPVCKDASDTTLPQVIDRYVRTGQAKMVFRPIAFISRSSERGLFGVEAAKRQDAAWKYATLIYRNQGPETEQDWLTEDLLKEAASDLGLDVDTWQQDFAGGEVANEFYENEQQATADGVTGTPTFVVTGPGGQDTFSGGVGFGRFKQAMEKVGSSQ